MNEIRDIVDVCIVGVGACGGLVAKELAEAGFSVVGLAVIALGAGGSPPRRQRYICRGAVIVPKGREDPRSDKFAYVGAR